MKTQQQIRGAAEVAALKTMRSVGIGNWVQEAIRALSPLERAQVREVWDTMPGSTCFRDAFMVWYASLPE